MVPSTDLPECPKPITSDFCYHILGSQSPLTLSTHLRMPSNRVMIKSRTYVRKASLESFLVTACSFPYRHTSVSASLDPQRSEMRRRCLEYKWRGRRHLYLIRVDYSVPCAKPQPNFWDLLHVHPKSPNSHQRQKYLRQV